MPPREPGAWMWAEACELLERAERLHRQFFQPVGVRARRPTWEPPADIYEYRGELWIQVALPGVPAERVEVFIDGGHLVISGERTVPEEVRRGRLHRLEIPYGRFQRTIPLPAGRLELTRRELADGCLTLTLRRAG